MLYAENYWVGASANHINRANQSLINQGVATAPIKYTFQAGYKINLSGPTIKRLAAKDITAAVHYEIQDQFDQLDFGAYYNHEPFVFGFWYRGIPFLKQYEAGYANNDAMIILVGYSVPDRNYRIGYSYDVTISRLAANSGGAHEISMVFEVASKKQKRRSRRFIVPCAKF